MTKPPIVYDKTSKIRPRLVVLEGASVRLPICRPARIRTASHPRHATLALPAALAGTLPRPSCVIAPTQKPPIAVRAPVPFRRTWRPWPLLRWNRWIDGDECVEGGSRGDGHPAASWSPALAWRANSHGSPSSWLLRGRPNVGVHNICSQKSLAGMALPWYTKGQIYPSAGSSANNKRGADRRQAGRPARSSSTQLQHHILMKFRLVLPR
jgi:hypothetical protein